MKCRKFPKEIISAASLYKNYPRVCWQSHWVNFSCFLLLLVLPWIPRCTHFLLLILDSAYMADGAQATCGAGKDLPGQSDPGGLGTRECGSGWREHCPSWNPPESMYSGRLPPGRIPRMQAGPLQLSAVGTAALRTFPSKQPAQRPLPGSHAHPLVCVALQPRQASTRSSTAMCALLHAALHHVGSAPADAATGCRARCRGPALWRPTAAKSPLGAGWARGPLEPESGCALRKQGVASSVVC